MLCGFWLVWNPKIFSQKVSSSRCPYLPSSQRSLFAVQVFLRFVSSCSFLWNIFSKYMVLNGSKGTYFWFVVKLSFPFLFCVYSVMRKEKWVKLSHINNNESVHFSSVAQLGPTLCDPMDCSTPGLPVHHQLPEFTQTHVHWVGEAIQPSHPLLSPSPPALNLSQHQGLFQRVSSSHQVAKVLEFQLQHQFFQWTPRTDLTRKDWLDLLAVQGTLKSLLQHHSSKASILWRSAFFIVHLLHLYMTTGKTIALTRRTFVGKVISLLFNMLSSLVMIFFQGVRVF